MTPISRLRILSEGGYAGEPSGDYVKVPERDLRLVLAAIEPAKGLIEYQTAGAPDFCDWDSRFDAIENVLSVLYGEQP